MSGAEAPDLVDRRLRRPTPSKGLWSPLQAPLPALRRNAAVGASLNTPNYYQFSAPVVADGLRITASSAGTCVDELVIYATSAF